MSIQALVIIQRFVDAARNTGFFQRIASCTVVLENLREVSFDVGLSVALQNHLQNRSLRLAGNVGGVGAFHLKSGDVDFVNLLPFLPGQMSGIPLLCSSLEEPAVNLLELNREVTDIRTECFFGEGRVACIQFLLEFSGNPDGLFLRYHRELDKAGVRISVDYFVSVVVDDFSGVLDNGAANGGNCRSNVSVVEAEAGKAGNTVVRVHDDL